MPHTSSFLNSPVDTLISPSPAQSPQIHASLHLVDSTEASSPRISKARKLVLLVLFCIAQFLDIFNISALFSAIPTLRNDLGFDESGATWLTSAYQLTFASFLLISGKIVDVYDPSKLTRIFFKLGRLAWLMFLSEKSFIAGIAVLGLISLGAGFLDAQIPLIVLRALEGLAAAQTVPSALTLLVNVFSEPDEQALAIGVFGEPLPTVSVLQFTSLNISAEPPHCPVLGLIIGAIFVQYASWRWVFWFVTLIALPVAGLCAWLVPPQVLTENRIQPSKEKIRRLDIFGVSLLTVALILFIFAITSGSTAGWKSVMVLAPLIISVLMVAAFFVHEIRIPERYAAMLVPPLLSMMVEADVRT
jgi:MFS family permease